MDNLDDYIIMEEENDDEDVEVSGLCLKNIIL